MSKILILEADLTFGHLLQDVLREEGCDAIFVSDEDLAMAKIGEMRLDLIISNGRDRVPFLRRARSAAPNTPIMVLTGGGSFAVYNLWADVVIAKPVDLPVLIGSIQILLNKAESAPA